MKASSPVLLIYAAHKLVAKAIREGKIIRQPCEVCDNPKTAAHHDDYSKPLEVRWLCYKHHTDWHSYPLWVYHLFPSTLSMME